jgi:ribosome recycling factor
MAFDIADLKKRMEGALNAFGQELTGLRTGRASTALLEHVQVEAYGGMMPISQVASVNAPEARMLVVQVWDAQMTKAVEKAISNAGLGLNPMAEGTVIRVPLPELSEERRKELVKVAHKYAEQAKVAMRNIRRDGMDKLKQLEKDGEIAKDEHHKLGEQVQKITDEYTAKADTKLAEKEKDIMQV